MHLPPPRPIATRAVLAVALLLLLPSSSVAQLTRAEAVAVLEREVTLAPDTPVWSPFVDFGAGPGFEGRLPLGSTVEPAFENHPLQTTAVHTADESYVFLIDDDPIALWSHFVRFAIIDANQPFATATAAVTDESWWLEINIGGLATEYFINRRSDSPADPTNSDGLVRGIAETVTPMAKSEPRVAVPKVTAFKGDPCALLFTGSNDNTFNDDLDRFEGQMAARGMGATRIKKKKGGKLSDLTALVTQVCAITPECDKIFVFLGGHGLPNKFFGQGANDAEKEITEAELKAALAPLATKNAKLCVIVQACHSGSLIDGLSETLKGATIISSTDECTVGWGGGFYDLPQTGGGRTFIGNRSVFSGAFSDCWDNDSADKNQPPNGVDWDEAWDWVDTQNPTVYWGDTPYRPKDPGPMRGDPQYKGSVWVNSWTCQPGETRTIKVHGTVDPTDKPVTFIVQNGRTGLGANTPIGGTDNGDLDNVDSTPQTVTVMANGKFWEDFTITCPPTAPEGFTAIYKVILKIDGHTVDVDYGCVNAVAVSPTDQRQTAVLPEPASSETPYNGFAPARYVITNMGLADAQYQVELNAFNHYDTARADLFHSSGLLFVELEGLPTLTGVTPAVPAGGSIEVIVHVVPQPVTFPAATFPAAANLVAVNLFAAKRVQPSSLSGFTLDMAVVDFIGGSATNASATVLLLGGPVATDPVPAKAMLWNYPNPFNPSTSIVFRMSVAGTARLDVFDLLGRRVRQLANEAFMEGVQRVVWDGRDDAGRPVASGAYFVGLEAPGVSERRKIALLK